MLENKYTEELQALADDRLKYAEQYLEERQKFARAKIELDLTYTTKIKSINEIKKNSGYETGLLLLLSIEKNLRETYKDLITSQQRYKGLEKLLEAYESKIFAITSEMKFLGKHDSK